MRKHYAWVIMIACFILQAATTGIYLNCSALYVPQIVKEMGFSTGSYSTTITIRTLFNAVGVYLCANIYSKKNYKAIFVICALICSLAFGLQIFYSKLWHWQLSNVILGVSLGFILTVPLVIMIQNWFKSRQGFALGLAMTGSGVAGMILNPLSSFVITNFGWRSGVILLALLSFLMILVIIIFVAKWEPDEMGLERYSETLDAAGDKAEHYAKRDHKELVFSGMLVVIIFYLISQYNQSISMYLDSLGMSVMFAGIISSIMMAGNVGGKLLIGYLADRLGTMRVFETTIIGILFSFVIFSFFPKEIFLVPAAFFYGLSMSLASLGPGLISKELLSGNEKKILMGKITSFANIANALYMMVISYSFDLFGSYIPIFTIAIPLCLLTMYFLKMIERKIRV